MKMSRWFFALLCLVAVPSAQAGLIEIHAGGGLNSANSDDFEDEVKATTGDGVSSNDFENYFADLYFDLPVLPIGFGLRHEWINQDDSAGGTSFDLEASNLSLIVDWRILDNVVYLGPIVSIGYPSADIDFSSGGSSVSDSVTGKPSYSLGAEVGAKFSIFMVGAEAGYQSIEFDDFQASSGGNKVNVDLSGYYGKVLVGLSFL